MEEDVELESCDEQFKRMSEVFEKLSPDKREKVLDFMKFLRDYDDKNEEDT